MNRDKRDDLFEGLRVPHAPAELERRVLSAAATSDRTDTSPTIWDKLWESRPLRVAWGLATLGLLLANAGLSWPTGAPRPEGDTRTADRRQARELHELLALPQVEISPRAAARFLQTTPRNEPTGTPDSSGRS